MGRGGVNVTLEWLAPSPKPASDWDETFVWDEMQIIRPLINRLITLVIQLGRIYNMPTKPFFIAEELH
jgi:hypothetical protein